MKTRVPGYTQRFFMLVLMGGVVVASPSWARKGQGKRLQDDPVRMMSSTERGSGVNMHMAPGLLSYGSSFSLGLVASPSLSVLLLMTDKVWVDLFGGIEGTSPFTNIGFGVLGKVLLAGKKELGFYVGSGVNLGAAQNVFFANLLGVAGVVFTPGGSLDRLLITFDAGPALQVTPLTNLTVSPYSLLLGLGLHYEI